MNPDHNMRKLITGVALVTSNGAAFLFCLLSIVHAIKPKKMAH